MLFQFGFEFLYNPTYINQSNTRSRLSEQSALENPTTRPAAQCDMLNTI